LTTPLSAFRDSCRQNKDLWPLFDAVQIAALNFVRAECDGALQKLTTGDISTDVAREITRNETAFIAAKTTLAEKATSVGISPPDAYSEDDVFQLLT